MAPNKTAGITLRAGADTAAASAELNKFLGETERGAASAAKGMSESYKSSLESIRNYSAVALAATTAASGFALRAAQQAETSASRAASAVTVAGGSWAFYKSEVLGAAAALQGLTKYSEEELLDTFARTVALTGDVEQGLAAMSKTADLAAALQIDLGAAGDIYSKALTGNVEVLGRVLPALRAKLEALGEDATAADKTALAMQELGKFTGTAASQMETAAGITNTLTDATGELQESVGNALTPAFNTLAAALTPIVTAIGEWVDKNPELTAGLAAATLVVTGLTTAAAALAVTLPAVSAGLTAVGVSASLIPGFGWAIAGAAAVAGLAAASLTGAENAERHTRALETNAEIAAALTKNAPKTLTVNIGGAHDFTDEEIAAEKAARDKARRDRMEAELADYRLLTGKRGDLFLFELETEAANSSAATKARYDTELADYRELTGKKGAFFIQGLEIEQNTATQARDAKLALWQEEEAVWQGHLGSMSAAYDTFTNTLLNTDMTGKQRARAMLNSAGAAFIQDIGARLKHAIAAELLILKTKTMATAAGAAADSAGTAVQVANSQTRAAAESTSLAAKVYAFYASLGPFGVPAAAATLAVMFAGITSFASKFASGGPVPGRGSGDTVPAMLTPGEFVVNRNAAQANLPLLSAINSGRGGSVRLGGGGPVIHIHTDRDASTADVLRLRSLFDQWLAPALEAATERGAFSPGYAGVQRGGF